MSKHSQRSQTPGEPQVLFQDNPLPMWVYDAETLCFLDANKAAVKQYGYSRAEFLKMRLSDVSEGENVSHSKVKPQSSRRRTKNEVRQVRHCRKDGSVINVEITSRKLAYAGRKAVCAVMRNVTEPQRGPEAADQALDYAQRILAASPVGIITYKASGEVISANEAIARIIGATLEEVYALNFRKLKSWKQSGMLAAAEKALASGVEQKIETPVVSTFGKPLWLSCQFVPFQHEGESRLLALFSDITEKKRAEDALRQSEARYRDLVENTRLLMCTHDLQGTVLSINPWAARVLGYESKNLIGKNIQDILVPESRPLFQRYLRSIRRSGTANGLMHILTASGERRVWEYHNTLRTEGVAEPIVRGTAYDVTERIAAERALRQSEAMYRGLFDSVLDGIFRTTPDGRFISANPALVQMLGFESENDLLSLNVQSLYLDSRVRERNIEKIRDTGEIRDLEIELRRRDGTTLVALENSRAVRDAKGQAILYEGSLTDITQRKRMEEALRASEGELRALFEAIPDVVLVLDKDGRYLKIATGKANSLYQPAEDLLGKRMHDIFSRPKADEFVGHIQTALRTGKPAQFEYALLIGDRIMWFSGATAPLTGDTVVWVARDITPQKQVEEQVQRRLVELEALYESGLNLSQTLDPRQISQRVIKVLSERLNWHHAAVRVRRGDSDDVELLAFSEAEDQSGSATEGQLRAREAITKIGQGMAGWVMKHGRIINSSNLQDDPRYHATFPNMLSGLYVPIWAGGRVLGCISVESHQREAFTEADELLLTTLASQAAAALENARLFAETQQRAAQSLTLLEVTRDLTTQTELPSLLPTLAARIASLLNVVGGAVYLYQPETGELEIVIATHDSLPVGTRLKMGEGMAGRVAESRQPLMIEDYRDWAGRSSQYEGQPFAAVLEVPMLYRGELIGVLAAYNLHYDDPALEGKNRKFGEADVQLFSLFAASAAGAVYSARLFEAERLRREEAEALRSAAVLSAERLATLHAATREIARISQEPEQVYASIHQAASRLMPTEAFTITLLDEEHHQVEGVYLFDRDGRAPSMNIPFGQGFSSQVILRGETIVLSDAESAEFEGVHFGSPDHVRSVLAVPLRVGANVIGVISTQSYRPDVYGREDQVLFEMLAAQAAIAIQNARLFADAQQRAQEFQTLYEMANDVAVQRDISSLLQTIVGRAAELLYTARGGIYLYDAEQGDLVSTVRVGVDIQPGTRLQLGEGAAGRVAQTREPLIIDDYQTWEGRSPKYEGVPFRAILQVPMLYGGELIGVLTVDEYGTDSTRKFSQEDARLLSLFASHAAGVIHNARLFDQTRRRLAELESLTKVGEALTGTLELEPLLENILRSARQAIPAAEKGTILLREENGQGRLRVHAQVGYQDPDLMGRSFEDSLGYSGRAFHEKRPILIRDSLAEYEIPFHQQFEEVNAVQSAIVVPLIVKDEAIGVISLDNASRISAFDEDDLRLLVLFASSAAVVIENARLFEETRRRADEFETLYETTRDVGAHQQDPSSLLSTLIERAVHLLGAYGGAIYLYDSRHNDLELSVVFGLTDGRGARVPLGEGAAGRVAQTRTPLVIDDYQNWPDRRALLEGVPYRALLQVPMLYGGDLIGVLDVYEYGDSERKFTEQDVKLLSLFAAHAAGAVHNARLFEETSKRASEFASLYETARDLSDQRDLDQLLNTIVERAGTLLNAPVSGIYLYDQARNDLYVAVNRGFASSLSIRLAMGEGVAGRVAQSRQPIIIEDHQNWEGRSRHYDGAPLRSVLEVPMLYGGELIGVLTVDEIGDSDRKFTQDDAHLLSLFASQAAGAVYGARLLDQARQRVEELKAIAKVSSALRVASTRADMAPIILAQLREILNADGAAFLTLDPVTQNIVNELGDGSLEPLTGLIVPNGEGLSREVIESRQIYTTSDLQADPRVFSADRIKNARSTAIAPLVSQDAPLGALWVTRDERDGILPPPFDERELRILSAIADMTANAIQRVSLYEQTTVYAEQLVTINAMGHALSETLDLPRIYEKVAHSALDLLPDTATVYISLFDPQTRLITAAYGLQDGELINVAALPSFPFEESAAGNQSKVILTGEPLVVADLNDSLKGQQVVQVKGADDERHTQSALYVPMKAEGRVIGVLQLQSYTKSRYTPGDAELLELAANTAAAAIQNTRLFSQLKRRVDQLSALHTVDTAIGSTTDLRVSLQAVLENITRQLRVDAADVLLLNSSTLMLQYAAGIGFFTSEITRTSSSIGRGLAGKAALERRMVHIPDLAADQTGFLRSNLVAVERFMAYLAVPLIAKGEVKGVLEIFHRAPLDIDQERRSFLEMFAGQAALAIDNALLFESLEKANLELTIAYDATIEGWSQALELRDQETQGHSARVLDLTLRLAAAMGLPDREMQDIRRGVLLHDIGKMGIPDSILHKPGALTDEEWGIMHKHPQYAYDMLAPIVYLRNSLDIPYSHHEKWDGSGYPRGLRGETIPLAARIFSVVDVYDALTSDRPYRGPWSKEKTIEYINEQSGKHFDPHIVEVFLKLIES